MCGRYRSSSVRPDRFPLIFESGLVVRIFCISLGLAQSRLFIGVVFPHIVFARQPITMFLSVLEDQPITKFSITELRSKSFVWVLHAELIAELLRLFNIFIPLFTFGLLLTLCYVMLAISSSLSLTPLTYLAGQL